MSIKQSRRILHWFIPLASVGGLCIFTATFLAYSSAHAAHRVAGYTPAILGLLCFAILMTVINYLSLPGPKDWLCFGTAFGIAILESAAFCFLFIVLLLKTFGT